MASKSSLPVKTDIVLIGAGIMSATLAAMIKELDPKMEIIVLERLDVIAGESSDAWNNAGTGHSALCELNYTPEKEDGGIDLSKAIKIFESFEESKEFWSYLVNKKLITDPTVFIHNIPHMSFVRGEKDVQFLKNRYEAMRKFHLFDEMEFTEGRDTLQQWIPLVMEGRDSAEPVAATRVNSGTDVNFGALSRKIFEYVSLQFGVKIQLAHDVEDLKKQPDGSWNIETKNLTTKKKKTFNAKFV